MNDGTRLRLDQAEKLLDGESSNGTWPRCAIWLTRLALENELDQLWDRRNPEVRGCTRRSQFLALGVVIDGATSYRVAELWTTLSRAAHHHHYELAPTVAELRGWLNEARPLCAHLAGCN